MTAADDIRRVGANPPYATWLIQDAATEGCTTVHAILTQRDGPGAVARKALCATLLGRQWTHDAIERFYGLPSGWAGGPEVKRPIAKPTRVDLKVSSVVPPSLRPVPARRLHLVAAPKAARATSEPMKPEPRVIVTPWPAELPSPVQPVAPTPLPERRPVIGADVRTAIARWRKEAADSARVWAATYASLREAPELMGLFEEIERLSSSGYQPGGARERSAIEGKAE